MRGVKFDRETGLVSVARPVKTSADMMAPERRVCMVGYFDGVGNCNCGDGAGPSMCQCEWSKRPDQFSSHN
jgi:hypothetical protein